jgi:3-oxoacyl-[acyl-carrier protein] reductase
MLTLLGATDTAMARAPLKTVMGPLYGMDKTEDELLQLVVQNIPMGRIGQPDDMANAVDFLLSDLSSYVTGQILCVAGGMV